MVLQRDRLANLEPTGRGAAAATGVDRAQRESRRLSLSLLARSGPGCPLGEPGAHLLRSGVRRAGGDRSARCIDERPHQFWRASLSCGDLRAAPAVRSRPHERNAAIAATATGERGTARPAAAAD